MEDIKAEKIANADWDVIYKELVRYLEWRRYTTDSRLFSRPGSEHLGLGKTCEDIAQDIIVKVIDETLKWDPSDPIKGDLLNTLKYHGRSALSNLVSKQSFKKELLVVDEDDSDYPQEPEESSEEYIQSRWLLLREAVAGDPELDEFLKAMDAMLEKNLNLTRKSLADFLGVQPSEITNRKKRLRRCIQKIQNEKSKEY